MDVRRRTPVRRARSTAIGVAAVLGLVVCAALPASAAAGTVTFTSPNQDVVRDTLIYRAASGEKNRLSIRLSGSSYALRDTGAPLTAGAGCMAAGRDVVCSGATSDQNPAELSLGDRDDVLSIAIDGPNVFGAAGNDTMTVSAHPAQTFPDAAHPNEGVGLNGQDGNDRLYGGPHDDVLDGGKGNDLLVAGGGRNQLSGGSGNEKIYATNRRRDTVDCGAGHDTAYVDRKDRVSHCELVHRY